MTIYSSRKSWKCSPETPSSKPTRNSSARSVSSESVSRPEERKQVVGQSWVYKGLDPALGWFRIRLTLFFRFKLIKINTCAGSIGRNTKGFFVVLPLFQVSNWEPSLETKAVFFYCAYIIAYVHMRFPPVKSFLELSVLWYKMLQLRWPRKPRK